MKKSPNEKLSPSDDEDKNEDHTSPQEADDKNEASKESMHEQAKLQEEQ